MTPDQWLRSWGINVNEVTGERLFALVMLQHAIDDALLPPDGLDYEHTVDRASALAWFRGTPDGRFPFRLVCEVLDIDPPWFRQRMRREMAKEGRERTVLTLNALLSKLDGRKKLPHPSPLQTASPSPAIGRLHIVRQLQALLT